MNNNQVFYTEYKAKWISTIDLIIFVVIAMLIFFYTGSIVAILAMFVLMVIGAIFRSKNQKIIISDSKIVLGSVAYALSGSVSGEIANMQRISIGMFFMKITSFNNDKQKEEKILLPRWLYSTKTLKDIAHALHTKKSKIEMINI